MRPTPPQVPPRCGQHYSLAYQRWLRPPAYTSNVRGDHYQLAGQCIHPLKRVDDALGLGAIEAKREEMDNA